MGQVMLALIPGTMVMVHALGTGVIINLVVLTLSSVACEAGLLALRKRPVFSVLADGSIILAAWLLALCLPPALPINQLILGAVAMTVLGKHVYGGLGQNPFNPAMVGYAILLISFPQSMTLWFDPIVLSELSAEGFTSFSNWWNLKWQPALYVHQWDSVTQATPLDSLRTVQRQDLTPNPALNQTTVTTRVSTSPWFEISIAWMIGGLYLLALGIIRWHIPVAMLLTTAFAHLVHAGFYPDASLNPLSALMYGGLMLGAFFIATDPVTAPSSTRARLCYGAGIGVLIVVLRTSSNDPEGVAIAVLLMNSVTPLLDRLFVLETRS